MTVSSLLLLLSLSAKSDKSMLDGKWAIIYNETPADAILLAGKSNLNLEGKCYGTNNKGGTIEITWSDNGFEIEFGMKNEKRVRVNCRGKKICVKSYSTGPGKYNGADFGGYFQMKVLSKDAEIVWRDDHAEKDFSLSISHERACLRMLGATSKHAHEKVYVKFRSKKAYGTCKSINY